MNRIKILFAVSFVLTWVGCSGSATTASTGSSSSEQTASSSSDGVPSSSSSSTAIANSSAGWVSSSVVVSSSSSSVLESSSSLVVYSSSVVVMSSSSVANSSSSVVLASSSSIAASSSSSSSSSSSLASSSSSDAPYWNTAISYGTLTDSRDGQTYRTVVIGAQTWMAQNLNYAPATGNTWCYSSDTANCTLYGRLYDFAAAQASCPTGSHLPDTTEWNTLVSATGDTASAGTALKAASLLWTSLPGFTNTDALGFSAIPGGNHYKNSPYFGGMGTLAVWWSTVSVGTSSYAYYESLQYSYKDAILDNNLKTDGFSVRCIIGP